MRVTWKDWVIGLFFFLLCVFSMAYIVDVILLDGLEIDKGLLGNVINGVISGGLTLVGVILTLKYGVFRDKQKEKPKKIAYSIIVYNELQYMINEIEQFIKSFDSYEVELNNWILEDPEEQRASRTMEYINKLKKLNNMDDFDEKIILIGDELYLEFDLFKNKVELLSLEINKMISNDLVSRKKDSEIFSKLVSISKVKNENKESIKELLNQQLQCFKDFQNILLNEKEKLQK